MHILLMLLAAIGSSALLHAQRFESVHRALPWLAEHQQVMTAAGDFDGDGAVDLVLGSGWPERILLNDGMGVFHEAVGALPPPPMRQHALGGEVAVGDLDGDGDADVFVGGSSAPHLVYLNDGTGAFVRVDVPHLSRFSGVFAVTLGDVDRDGDLDALLGSNEAYHLLLNDGSGRFGDESFSRLPWEGLGGQRVNDVALADVDQDGDLDALVAGHLNGSRLLINDGRGYFSGAPSQAPVLRYTNYAAVDCGDLDGDGDLDLYLTSSIPFASYPHGLDQVLINDGTGTFQLDPTATPSTAFFASDVTLTDVDNDGALDAFVTRYAGAMLLLNDGGGRFREAPTAVADGGLPAKQVTAADFDADGDPDMLVTRSDSRHALLLNDGAGRFADVAFPDLHSLSTNGSYLQENTILTDLDGDGVPDLLVGGGIGTMRSSVNLNNGDGSFADTAPQMFPNQAPPLAMAAGDVDGDGDGDVVFATQTPTPPLYLNDGAGRFSQAPTGRIPASPSAVNSAALLDVDNDADLDAVCVLADGTASLLVNDGTGTYSGPTTWTLPGWPWGLSDHIRSGDLDGDGDTDLLFGGAPPPVFLNDGSGRFTAAGALPHGRYAVRDLSLGDVDGDGDLDCLAGGSASHSALYANDGSANFADVTATRFAIPPPLVRGSASLLDVDGDGDLDALFEATALFENDGRGHFVDRSVDLPALPASAVGMDHSFGDIDGDGDVDLVVGTQDVWRNMTRHIAWRRVPRIGRPLELEVRGTPGQVWLAWASTGRTHVTLPFGALRIHPTRILFNPAGPLDALGVGSVTVRVPNDPRLAGFRLHWQALILPSTRLTNVETTTILPL